MFAHIHIRKVPCRLWAAMHGIMLWRRDHAIILGIISLHAGNKGDPHAAREKWVFSIGLLSASPPRIAEYVQIRRPEIETVKYRRFTVACRVVINDPALDSNIGSHRVNRRHIEGGSQSDRFRELSRAIDRNPMQCLTPPVVRRNLEPWNCARLMHELRCFLF